MYFSRLFQSKEFNAKLLQICVLNNGCGNKPLYCAIQQHKILNVPKCNYSCSSQQMLKSASTQIIYKQMSNSNNGILGSIFHPIITQTRGKKAKTKKVQQSESAKPKVQLNKEELDKVINFTQYEQLLMESTNKLKQEYIEKMTFRKSALSFDNLLIDTPDGKFLLIHLAQITQKTPEMYVIDMTTAPQYMPQVKDAIENSLEHLDVKLQQEKTTFYAQMSKFTVEHRKKLADSAKQLWNNTKDKQRSLHNQYVKKLEKAVKIEACSDDYVRALKATMEYAMKREHSACDELMKTKQKYLLDGIDNK